ncbi:MAG TPA: TIM barrel protein [bacterium]|nr:TIM barrel protein [bacterium]HPN44672.1 TIM barrel protein [bacterium]
MYGTESGYSRREFLYKTAIAGGGLLSLGALAGCAKKSASLNANMQFGLVTYQWGKDWDLPTLIKNCELSQVHAVELRTLHAHGVEPSLTTEQRVEVKKRFSDSPVICLGYGSNQEYHSPDPVILQKNIDETCELIKLCHDIGATGLKVKPNDLPDEIPPEKTIAQIAAALNRVGTFAAEYGQKIRVEVHGRKTQELPNMKAIFDQVTAKNVFMCWNCNDEDLLPPGLEANFNLVQDRLGDTVHIRELNIGNYPYPQLFGLLAGMNYHGNILLEARTEPADLVAALIEQQKIFTEMIEATKD